MATVCMWLHSATHIKVGGQSVVFLKTSSDNIIDVQRCVIISMIFRHMDINGSLSNLAHIDSRTTVHAYSTHEIEMVWTRAFKKHCTQRSLRSWISIAHSKAFVHGFLFKKRRKKTSWIGEASWRHQANPLPHTDTSMSAANACLADLLSSTTEKACT